jgi:hypothetical protein
MEFAPNPGRRAEMEGQRSKDRYRLGDLIAALFEESKRYTTNRAEQTVLVCAALKDLLQGKVHPAHPIQIRVPKL